MTEYVKLAISLPLRAAENARKAVREGRAASVSAYIASAIDDKVSKEQTLAMLAGMLEETGPLTAAEERWVNRALATSDRVGSARAPRQPKRSKRR